MTGIISLMIWQSHRKLIVASWTCHTQSAGWLKWKCSSIYSYLCFVWIEFSDDTNMLLSGEWCMASPMGGCILVSFSGKRWGLFVQDISEIQFSWLWKVLYAGLIWYSLEGAWATCSDYHDPESISFCIFLWDPSYSNFD